MLQAKDLGLALVIALAFISGPAARAGEQTVHVYNWNDYFAPDTLTGFEQETGIRAVLDLYDSNEVLEAKLLAGSSGYDLVFPTTHPFAARHLKAGLYQPLDHSKLPGLERLDPDIMANLAKVDPGNRYLVPYMWGTTGLGINPDRVHAALGEDAPLDTWGLIFDPEQAKKLAGCGISLLDDPTEVFSAALTYLGKDPNSQAPEDLEAAAELIKQVRPYIRYFHSSQYISDLANGATCVAHGYSGDILQARERAAEANKGVTVIYRVPREGAVLWVDVMAIPKDAPNPEAAHALIAYLLKPEVIAAASNHIFYANANSAATSLLSAELREDPEIYPPPEVRARLFTPSERSEREIRNLNRLWTRLKSGR